MKQHVLVVGIDVAKEKLDVAIYNGKEFILRIYSNTEEGIDKLIKKVEGISSISSISHENIHFVMEATGSYHRKVLHALLQQNYNVYVLNPLILKRYSDEQLKRTTTDKGSSKLLSSYAYSSILSFLSNIPSESYNTLISFKVNPSDETNSELKILMKVLEGLMREKTRILNQIEALEQYPEEYANKAIESLRRLLEEIEKEIKNIEDKINEITHREENSALYRRLTTIPGIGSRSASALIAYFGTFANFDSPKQVASYIGLTPSIKESGKSVKKKGYAISKVGNPYLRQLLFMASLSASRHNHQCSILYDRLIKEGKDKKVALIAVSHKLLRQAFAVAKYGRIYDPNYGLENIIKEDITPTPQNVKREDRVYTTSPYNFSILQNEYTGITDY